MSDDRLEPPSSSVACLLALHVVVGDLLVYARVYRHGSAAAPRRPDTLYWVLVLGCRGLARAPVAQFLALRRAQSRSEVPKARSRN
jgi:hypothetical protein